MNKILLTAFLAAGIGSAANAKKDAVTTSSRSSEFYTIGKVMMPTSVSPQIGGLDALPDGRLVACFHHGEVGIYQPKDKTWKIFAEGLHEPLGILVENERSILVMQRAELTRLKDEDGDGVADFYQTVCDDFGMTGNYHEFAFGPVRGPDGMLYIALNLASQGDTIFKEVRGEFSPIGVPREEFYKNYGKVKNEVGRMYSRVPYRGWVLQVDPATGKGVPWACGFRSPDGISFDGSGNLLVDDNQGDWRGSSELFVVKKSGFYGHPASLVWRDDWDGRVPLRVPVSDLEKIRTKAAIWFPHGIFANSPTQIVTIPKSKAWGPYGGQLLIGEMNSAKLIRAMLEECDGTWQGAIVNLTDDRELKSGLHRLKFIGDTLYIGRTHLSWAGGEGIGTLQPTGRTPFDILKMEITRNGFRFTFTRPLDETSSLAELWDGEEYTYHYHKTYGSPQVDKSSIEVTKVEVSPDRKTAEVELASIKTDYVYEFRLDKLKAGDGNALLNPRIAYTVRSVPK